MASFVLSFFPLDVLDGIWDLIESVSEGFLTYSFRGEDMLRFRLKRKWSTKKRGWSGGAKVLGKLPVLGRPTYLDFSRARAYCACKMCGWGLFGHFFSHLPLLFSVSLSMGDGPI